MIHARFSAFAVIILLTRHAAGVAVTEAPPAVAAKQAEQAMVNAIAQIVGSYVFIGGGSGVLISSDGFMLTNHHVAGTSSRWKVRVGTRQYQADVVGNDPRGDITLLKLRDAAGLPFVELADSDKLFIGQRVIAVGNPFATADVDGEPTVTQGIISALHRFQNSYTDAIQTDAAINPGNSGGPLLTLDGRLAGINGQIAPRYGARANTGIGYAIPANQIRRFLPLLKAAKGKFVYHGYLRELTPEQREGDGIRNGAEIQAVEPGSAAAKAGIKAGDRITAIDGMPLLNFERFLGITGAYPGGSQVTMTLLRGGKTEQLPVTLESLNPGGWGFQHRQRRPAPGSRRWEIEKALAAPIMVDQIYPGLAAEKAKLKVGDQVIAVNGLPTLTFRDWLQAEGRLGLLLAGDQVKLGIRRVTDGKFQALTIEITLTARFDEPDALKQEPDQPGEPAP